MSDHLLNVLRLRSNMVSSPSSCPVPKTWNPKDRFGYIGLSKGNLRVHYRWVGEGPKDGASVRSICPIPASCGIFYFEVTVMSRGGDGGISIGLTPGGSNLNSLPGFVKSTYGYFGREGTKHNGSLLGKPYGPAFNSGDVIGCGINFIDNTCFFTKNGHYLGVAFTDLPSSLYATVGLQTANGVVEGNFGQTPFAYDIEEMKKDISAHVKVSIDKHHLVETVHEKFDIEKIVSTYLLHNGYCETAQILASSLHQEIKIDVESVRNRQKIIKMVQTGRITDAMALTDTLYPGLLEGRPDLHFMLRVRQFIEVVAGSDESWTDLKDMYMDVDCQNGVENGDHPQNGSGDQNGGNHKLQRILNCGRKLYSFSQRIFNEYGMCEVNRCRMRDAFSLLAYSDPRTSPVGWQLEPSQREIVSFHLNSAILELANVSRKSPLEMAFNHAKALINLMLDSGIGAAAFVSFDDYVLN